MSLFSQKTPVYEYGDNDYLSGLELYEKEKYGAARQVFDGLIAENPGSRSEIVSEAYFLQGHVGC